MDLNTSFFLQLCSKYPYCIILTPTKLQNSSSISFLLGSSSKFRSHAALSFITDTVYSVHVSHVHFVGDISYHSELLRVVPSQDSVCKQMTSRSRRDDKRYNPSFMSQVLYFIFRDILQSNQYKIRVLSKYHRFISSLESETWPITFIPRTVFHSLHGKFCWRRIWECAGFLTEIHRRHSTNKSMF